jgi:hypothetical protein
VITPYVGGGFGGKVPGQQAVEAARLAKITGKPVQVCWTRAEEFFYDTFRPAAVIKVTSGIDAAGRVVLWDYQVYGAGSRGSDVFYDIANRSVRVYGEWRGAPNGMHPFAVGAWRAPAANSNRFAAEQQIDTIRPCPRPAGGSRRWRRARTVAVAASPAGLTPRPMLPSWPTSPWIPRLVWSRWSAWCARRTWGSW